MKRVSIAVSLLASLQGSCVGPSETVAPSIGQARVNTKAPAQAFVNGRWFDGIGFKQQTMYAVHGVLQTSSPSKIDSVIDLHGGWVIPPFGDAHTHMLSGPGSLDPFRGRYLHEGTFYVQVLGNRWSTTQQIRENFNSPCSLDVTWANGFLTSTLGHGFETGESKAMGLFDLAAALRDHGAELRRSRIGENDAYWFIDSLPDLDKKWGAVLAQHPSLIKIALVFSADTGERALGAPSKWYAHGLRPQIVRNIVERAHKAGLRVAAHVDMGHDIEVAVRAGVDILAHNSGFGVPEGREADFRVSVDVARMAGAHNTIVIPTAATEADFRTRADTIGLQRDLTVQRENLRLFSKYGVTFAVGADMYGSTARSEFEALRRLGVWSDQELLKLWFGSTPRSIFPNRKIGTLREGYEASFLVLESNPFENLEAIDSIALRVKQGCILRG